MVGPKESRGEGLERRSDGLGVPDIQQGRKGLYAGALLALALAFAGGYWAARRTSQLDSNTSNGATEHGNRRAVELRLDPKQVRLADTALEWKPLPPPPKQNLTGDAQKP